MGWLVFVVVVAGHVLGPAAAQAQDPDELVFDTRGWATDFSVSSVPLDEIRPGGPPRDGIPSIDAPAFESVAVALEWLHPSAPVIALEVDGLARAYPLAILVWHEIVNDIIGETPVVVTFCPLCNTALVFDRVLDGVSHEFGTTGNLRFSDLVMYDRETESWWQQASGQAIVGQLTGSGLVFRPAQLISLGQFAEAWPEGAVLSRSTGFQRPYEEGSYVRSEADGGSVFRYAGEPIRGVAPKERVVTLGEGFDGIAVPHTELRTVGAVHETVGGEPVVVFWEPRGPVSSLDGIVGDANATGSTGVFSPLVDGRQLEFQRAGGEGQPIMDAQTGSTWTVTGRAVDGPLAGTQLRAVPHADHFWFAWAAFVPDTRIWSTEGTRTAEPVD